MNLAQTFNPWIAALVLGLTALFSACATTPPELVKARAAYQDAKQSPASQYAPAHLKEARTALSYAEEAFDEEGNDEITRTLAYRALRKAQLAMVQADIFLAKQSEEKNRQMFMAESERARKQLAMQLKEKSELAQMTAEELAEEQARIDQFKVVLEQERQAGQMSQYELQQRQLELQKAQAELEAERKAREDLEVRLEETRAELEKVAQIKEDAERLIITLNGAVLFEVGESVLLPTAQRRLDQVAEMLLAQKDTEIVVEGHTDSQGSDETNRELSQSRAAAVRDYLVSQGVASDRINAVGYGETQPIASNQSPEGRANNRRVEIVVNKQPGDERASFEERDESARLEIEQDSEETEVEIED